MISQQIKAPHLQRVFDEAKNVLLAVQSVNIISTALRAVFNRKEDCVCFSIKSKFILKVTCNIFV